MTVTVTVTVAESVHITFTDEDGAILDEFDIAKGSAIPAERYPTHQDDRYAYKFAYGDGYWDPQKTVDEDLTLIAYPYIADLEISISIEGRVATAAIDTAVEYTGAKYYWLYNDGSDEPNVIGMGNTQTLDADGQYALLVEIVDADGISGTAWFGFEYTAESDLPPFIPFPPEQGGDPVEVDPGQSGGSSDREDGTLKIVAVAAAAVIAAILAIVLASTYRRE